MPCSWHRSKLWFGDCTIIQSAGLLPCATSMQQPQIVKKSWQWNRAQSSLITVICRTIWSLPLCFCCCQCCVFQQCLCRSAATTSFAMPMMSPEAQWKEGCSMAVGVGCTPQKKSWLGVNIALLIYLHWVAHGLLGSAKPQLYLAAGSYLVLHIEETSDRRTSLWSYFIGLKKSCSTFSLKESRVNLRL